MQEPQKIIFVRGRLVMKFQVLNDIIAFYILSACFSSRNSYSRTKTKIKRKAKNEIVALTEEELFQILNYDLKNNIRLQRVRDLFCFGCFTGQRFSDIIRFDQQDLSGSKWSFISYKTKKRVIVPFTGFISKGLQILEKYNYQFPVISNQKFNDYLKEIGELAGIDSLVRIIGFSGVKEIDMRYPKHEFMSSHMARRTFVTLMIEKGVPLTMIQKITQHSDLTTLLKYEGHNEKSLENAFEKT